MSQDPLTDKLEKAARNISKLGEFFAARKDWELGPGADAPARDFVAAAQTAHTHLEHMIQSCGAKIITPNSTAVVDLPAGAFDAKRLTRFTTFLRDLGAWFAAQLVQPTEHAGIAALQQMEASLRTTIELMAPMAPPLEPAVESTPGASEGAATLTGESAASSEAAAAVPEGAPPQIVLDDTDERPLVQDFQGMKELTPDCDQLVDAFLASWKIEHARFNRKRFNERLLRWITSAPHGQVLVLKMSTLTTPFEPYPAYISREVLESEETESTS